MDRSIDLAVQHIYVQELVKLAKPVKLVKLLQFVKPVSPVLRGGWWGQSIQ